METRAAEPGGVSRPERPPRVVVLSGVVDAGVTRALQLLLLQLEPDERVVVDCRDARYWHADALPALGAALRGARCAVRLLGLGYHQQRLLRYLDPEASRSMGG